MVRPPLPFVFEKYLGKLAGTENKGYYTRILLIFVCVGFLVYSVISLIGSAVTQVQADDTKCHKAYGIQWDNQSVDATPDKENETNKRSICVNTEHPDQKRVVPGVGDSPQYFTITKTEQAK